MAAGCTEWATLAVRGSRSILSVPCFALMLCDRRENVDREFVRKWHISSDKFDDPKASCASINEQHGNRISK